MCAHVYVQIHMYVYLYIYICVYMCVYTRLYICIHAHIYVYIYIYSRACVCSMREVRTVLQPRTMLKSSLVEQSPPLRSRLQVETPSVLCVVQGCILWP